MTKLLKISALTLVASLAGISAANAAQVSQLEHGTWQGDMYTNYGDNVIPQNVWVDIQVENIGFDKEVSIVWTTNDWENTHVADAWYEGELAEGFEQWGVDIAPVGSLAAMYYGIQWEDIDGVHGVCSYTAETACVFDTKTFEYAIVVSDGEGNEYWDNNNGANYSIEIDNTDAVEQLRAAQ